MSSQVFVIALLLLANCLLTAECISMQNSIKAHDDVIVKGLENYTHYTKDWYSGYLNISKSNLEDIHYFFYPSQNNPSTDPFVLWLNGGPGCSSLVAALTENGPFLFKEKSEECYLNPYSWNLNASVLYLESPPGVGFSDTDSYQWNDNLTATANADALWNFFDIFSEFKGLDLYLTGESYSGMYVPYLAWEIHNRNQNLPADQQLNLKGFAVGNGCTHPLECSLNELIYRAEADFLYDQGFVSPVARQRYLQACKYNGSSDQCVSEFNYAMLQMNGSNPYNIIGWCYQNTEYKAKHLARWYNKKNLNDPDVLVCADCYGIMKFFNDPNVQSLLHIHLGTTPRKWDMCSDDVLNYTCDTRGSYFLYPHLIKAGYRIMVYSGDTDPCVPTQGTLYWINQLKEEFGLSDIEPWRGWFTNGQAPDYLRQNAGQFWKIDGITIVTVKGAGHMVPTYKPQEAYDMIMGFLYNYDLPAK